MPINMNISVSKNYVRGSKITSLDKLWELVEDSKAVYHRYWGVKPAMVLAHMQLTSIATSIEKELLYTIEQKVRPLLRFDRSWLDCSS